MLIESIHLATLVVLLGNGLVHSELVNKPYGIRMCEIRCKERGFCWYLYKTAQLACHLFDQTEPQTLWKVTEEVRLQVCHQISKFARHNNQQNCRRTYNGKQIRNTEQGKHDKVLARSNRQNKDAIQHVQHQRLSAQHGGIQTPPAQPMGQQRPHSQLRGFLTPPTQRKLYKQQPDDKHRHPRHHTRRPSGKSKPSVKHHSDGESKGLKRGQEQDKESKNRTVNRVLLLAFAWRKLKSPINTFSTVDFTTKRLTDAGGYVSAICAVHAVKRLVIATSKPKQIETRSYDWTSPTVHINWSVKSCAVDQEKQLVFFIRKNRRLIKFRIIAPNGLKNHTHFKVSNDRLKPPYSGIVLSMTVDPRTQVIYASFSSELKSYTYHGRASGFKLHNCIACVITFNDGYLYYSKFGEIIKKSARKKYTTRLATFENLPRGMLVEDNQLFVVFARSLSVEIADLNVKKKKPHFVSHSSGLQVSHSPGYIIMCPLK